MKRLELTDPHPIRLPEQTSALLALIESAYTDFGVPFNPEAPEEAHLLDIEGLRARGGDLWVIASEPTSADDGELLLGSIALHLDPSDQRLAELKTVYVHRAARRRGVGRRLMATATDAARASGATRVVLWSDTRFTAAHAFYERLGYRRLGETRHTDGWDTFDEIGFERAL